jgi:hypothetical protein
MIELELHASLMIDCSIEKAKNAAILQPNNQQLYGRFHCHLSHGIVIERVV